MNKNYLHIIIIFILVLTVLTGCTNKEIDNEKLRDLEQVNILEIKYLTLYERISGIQLTRQVMSIKQEENTKPEESGSGDKEDAKTNQENKIDNAIENSLESTRITYDNSALNDTIDPDWDTSKQLCYEIENIILDVLSEMKNYNDIETSNQFEETMNDLISAVVDEDKEKSTQSIANIYNYLLKFINDNIENKQIYEVKRLYYNSIQALIYLENKEEEKYESKISEIKNDNKEVLELESDKNIAYIIDKISTLISGLDEKYNQEQLKNSRLKLIMLIKTISNIDIYVQKVDNYQNL